MPSDIIQWFPGHMAKTRRLISENLKQVDIVIELLDARIPYSSRNPEIKKLLGDKPTLTILNKASLADPKASAKWVEYYSDKLTRCVLTDCTTGEGMKEVAAAINELMAEKLQRYSDKGMGGRKLRAMIVGIPNVGKSSLINRLSGAKKAKVENRPGVTLDKQWISTNIGVDLMDMPGVLWPKFDERRVGENLAITGAIKDNILDTETIAITLCGRLREFYPELLCSRYKIKDISELDGLEDYEVFELVGRKRGCLISGGEVNYERTAKMILDEYRSATIGRITLEMPKN